MKIMGMSQMLQVLAALPQLLESIKQMGPEEKRRFAAQLGLNEEETETVSKILSAFQEGHDLSPEDQSKAQIILEKGLKMNDLDIAGVMQMMSGLK